MARNRFILACLLVSCLFLSGCFGSEDINDLALVMAVGLDEPAPGKVQVTAQIARPADVVGQTGAPTGGTGEPVFTATGTGASIFEAMRNLARYSSRRVYWAHNKIIVINEELARDVGINDIVDFFTRNPELRMRTWVVVTPNRASELVATKTGLEVLPGTSVEKLFRYSRMVAEAPRIDMRQLQAQYLSDGAQVVLPVMKTRTRGVSSDDPMEFGATPQVELSGAAFFEKDKLRGVLTPSESSGLMWFVDSPTSRIVVLPCPDDPRAAATLEMKRHQFSITPIYYNGQIHFNVRLVGDFDMTELGCASKRSNKAIMTDLEKEAKKTLISEIMDVVHLSQQQKVDFLGLGERFQDRYPAEWLAMRSHWPDALASAKVTTDVTVHIHSPVLLQTPTVPAGTGDAN